MVDFDVAIIGGGPAGAAAAKEVTNRGLSAVIIEKKSMPRHKACSGLIIEDAVKVVAESFGTIPDDVHSTPSMYKAFRFHFPSGRTLNTPFKGGGALNVSRNLFDHWLCKESGATIKDATTKLSFLEDSTGVTIQCRNTAERSFALRCKTMIAAEGAYSTTARELDPTSFTNLRWFSLLHYSIACDIDLEPGYLHFFADDKLSLYPVVYADDGRLTIDVASCADENPREHLERVSNFLTKHHGYKPREIVRKQGCRCSWAAAQGWCNFGTDRVLLTGESSGLLNTFGEGISSALRSGVIAGRITAESLRANRAPGISYSLAAESERIRTVDTFSMMKMGAKGAAVDIKGTIRGVFRKPWWQHPLIFAEMLRWNLQNGGMKSRLTPN